MARTVTVKIKGLKELDRALGQLSKATARGVLTRTLKKAAVPIRDTAQRLSPKDTGALKESIIISTKKPKGHSEKKNAYAAAMRSGATRKEAGAAARAARAGAHESFAEAFVGPAQQRNKKAAIKTIVQEFGSINQPGTPYMRPAWDQKKGAALEIIKNELGDEIIKTAKRVAKRAAKADS